MITTPGRLVYYSLRSKDIERIKERRLKEQGNYNGFMQLYPVSIGSVFPMLVTDVVVEVQENNYEGYRLSGHVFLRGGDTVWVEEVLGPNIPGKDPSIAAGRWDWPPRVS